MADNKDCVFCKICEKDEHKQIIHRIRKDELLYVCDVVVFEPLKPCVEGHLLFVPDIHIDGIGDSKFYSSDVVASVYKAVNLYLLKYNTQCNVITNYGSNAEQTVFHLHVHLIPRFKGDNVKMPWSYQKGK